jgi:nucleotide-binding universal stress UspA family protein
LILICYDGSDDARAAIERAGKLFAGQQATVITVWEPFTDVMSRTGAAGLGLSIVDPTEIDAASQNAAREGADEGAESARQAGLDAQPHVAERHGTIAATILREAREREVDAIVVGTRGLTGIKSLMLGSVSNAIVQHADRPVTVIPSAELADRRRASGS